MTERQRLETAIAALKAQPNFPIFKKIQKDEKMNPEAILQIFNLV